MIVHVGRRSHRRSSSSSATHSRSNSLTENGTLNSSQQLQRSNKTTSTSALHFISSLEEDSIANQLTASGRKQSDSLQELTFTQKTSAHQKQQTYSVTEQLTDRTITSITGSRAKSLPPDLPAILNSEGNKEKEEVEEEEEEEERQEELGEEDEYKENVSLQELIDAELRLNQSSLELHSSPPKSPSVSSSAPSEVSTIVPRDLASSRCSGASFPEDTNPPDSLPPTSKPCSSATDTTRHPDGSVHPLSHSSKSPLPGESSPQVVVSQEPAAETHSGQTLFRSSPLLDVDALLSTHLSQSDTDASREPLEERRGEDPIDFPPSLIVSTPSPQPEATLPPTHTTSSSITAGVGHLPHCDHSLAQNTDSTAQLHLNPAVTALKEDHRKSFHSSSSSLDSATCSVIEVSYCYNSECDKASSNHSPAPVTPNYSSSSENESDSNYEVVPAEPVNHYLVDLEAVESHNLDGQLTTRLAQYHQSTQPEIDLETIPEEMAVRTQVMRIYPAQSVGETSSNVAVPHHRVHIPSTSSSSGPESPSTRTSTARGNGRVLYMTPTITETQEKVVKPIDESSALGPQVPDLMTTCVDVLHDDEEEEEEETEQVATQSRKTSGVSSYKCTCTCTCTVYSMSLDTACTYNLGHRLWYPILQC